MTDEYPLKQPDLPKILDVFKYAAKQGASHVEVFWDDKFCGISLDGKHEYNVAAVNNAESSLYAFQQDILGLKAFDPSPAVTFPLAALGVTNGGEVSIGRTKVFDRMRSFEFDLSEQHKRALLALDC